MSYFKMNESICIRSDIKISPCELTSNHLFYFPVHVGFRGLQEIDMETKQAIVDLLNKKRLPGLASWKQVARRYGMREKEITYLENAKNPAGAMLENLVSLSPNITVYYLCKTFKESRLRRMDVINVLLKHVVTPV